MKQKIINLTGKKIIIPVKSMTITIPVYREKIGIPLKDTVVGMIDGIKIIKEEPSKILSEIPKSDDTMYIVSPNVSRFIGNYKRYDFIMPNHIRKETDDSIYCESFRIIIN